MLYDKFLVSPVFTTNATLLQNFDYYRLKSNTLRLITEPSVSSEHLNLDHGRVQ
jgi:hypothetical protein